MVPHPFAFAPRIPTAAKGFALCLSLALCSGASAEPMLLTDLLGRSIRAEPVTLIGDNLKIRREDGQEFILDIKNLSDADKQKVLAWSRENPAPAEPESPKKEAPKYTHDLKKISLSMSRFKGDTTVLYKSIDYSHKHETVGYSFGVTNRNIYPVQGLRVEYNLFARAYDGYTTPTVVVGSLEFDSIDTGKSQTLKSKTAEICRYRGIDMNSGGGELRGVWVKLFMGDQLVQEIAPPESLRNEVTWQPPSKPRTN